MSDEQKSEIEGQGLRRDPAKEVEGQARRLTDDAPASEEEEQGDESRSGAESEVEGQLARPRDKELRRDQE
jgi:hypothetical protein